MFLPEAPFSSITTLSLFEFTRVKSSPSKAPYKLSDSMIWVDVKLEALLYVFSLKVKDYTDAEIYSNKSSN